MADTDADADEILEVFEGMIEADGMAAVIVDDGVMIGFNVEKLTELLKLASESPVGRIAVLIPKEDEAKPEPEMLN